MYRSGEPVVTARNSGKGAAYYVGTWLEQSALSDLVDDILATGAVARSEISAPDGLELVRRTGAGAEITFLLNWTCKPALINLPGSYTDLLTDTRFSGQAEAPARDLLILRAS